MKMPWGDLYPHELHKDWGRAYARLIVTLNHIKMELFAWGNMEDSQKGEEIEIIRDHKNLAQTLSWSIHVEELFWAYVS